MRSFLQSSTLFLLAVCALTATIQPAHAGPLRACIRATLSANGKILVVNDLTFDDPDESHARRPTMSTFRVLSRYVDINEPRRMKGPNTYWDMNSLWSLVLADYDQEPTCPYTLVTNDGEYLILVGGGFRLDTALSIYHRRDHPGQPFGGPGPDHGVLVKRILLAELWPPEKLPDGMTDNTPEWFAGGTFSFSADDRTLIHTTQWGTTFHISLETGKVTGTPMSAKQSVHTEPR